MSTAESFEACPRCGTPEPTILPGRGQLARCEHCRWMGHCVDERSQDDPAPRHVTLRWLRGVHPSPEKLESVMDDETSLPWDLETLVWISEQIGDTAGHELAEMASIAWGSEIQHLDTANDHHALRHVAEIVSAEAVSRMEDRDGRDEIRRRIRALMAELSGQGWELGDVAKEASDEMCALLRSSARREGIRVAS